MGAFRLLLAAMVVINHSGGTFNNTFLPGVAAVVVFFMISGYAITGLIQNRFPEADSAKFFFLERFVRLAPQYYFWLIISIYCSVYLQLPYYSINLNGFYPYGIFSYISLIPLALQSYIDPSYRVYTHVMAQASTLAIEISFYILSPWVLKSRKLSWIAAVVGLCIFASTALKVLPENIYTYYTSPGPVIFFILGSFLYKKEWTSLLTFSTALVSILILGLPQGFNMEFLVGVLIGVPILIFLTKIPTNKFDQALGAASYGVYLSHVVVIAVLSLWLGNEHPPLFRVYAVIISIFVGGCSFYLIERPLIPFKRSLKK